MLGLGLEVTKEERSGAGVLPTGEARVILLREKGINCPQFATWASVTGNLRLVKPRDLAGIDRAEYVFPAIPSRPRADTLW